MATRDLKLVAYTITISVVQANAVAIVAFFSVRARTIFIGSIRVVVTSLSILATCDLKLVAYTVAISVVQANAVTIVARLGIRARPIVFRCIHVVVARRSVCTTWNRVLTAAVIVFRRVIVVVRFRICATARI